ncbi:MAG: PIN domain-containing protein [Solirubrobacteraceae bacterium]|nr:PIN domain-containing protein [Solirubrobacteraceae bacterium]
MGRLTTLFDTSLLAEPTEGRTPNLDGDCAVSVITIGELHAGVLLARDDATQASRLRRLAAVLDMATVLDVDRAITARYGELRAAACRAPSNDLWIAATALAHDLQLLTADKGQATLPNVRVQLV